MATDTETAQEQDITTGAGWKALDREEQDAILQEKMEEDSSLTEEQGEFDYQEMDQASKQSAAARIEEKLEETWHAPVLDDVMMEFYTLQERHINLLKEMATLFAQIQDAETVDDLPEGALDTLEEADEELEEMLGEVCVQEPSDDPEEPDTFSQEWWASGEYPANLKMDVFGSLYERYQQGGEEIKN